MSKINALLNAVVDLLPAKAQPAAKAVLPSVATLVAVGVQWYTTKTFDTAELVTAVVGLSSSLVTFLFPNKSA